MLLKDDCRVVFLDILRIRYRDSRHVKQEVSFGTVITGEAVLISTELVETINSDVETTGGHSIPLSV